MLNQTQAPPTIAPDPIVIALAYYCAKRFVISSGYAPEIDWQAEVSVGSLSAQTFLSEGAWVILSAGMRERVIRDRFPAISEAFFDWSCADRIVAQGDHCKRLALRAFNHAGKIGAILSLAHRIAHDDFRLMTYRLVTEGPAYLESFDFIGPITSFHLAKNLGVNVAKEDRHLRRLAEAVGFDSAGDMCEAIAVQSLDSVRVIDIVLWRFATQRSDYCQLFSSWVLHGCAEETMYHPDVAPPPRSRLRTGYPRDCTMGEGRLKMANRKRISSSEDSC